MTAELQSLSRGKRIHIKRGNKDHVLKGPGPESHLTGYMIKMIMRYYYIRNRMFQKNQVKVAGNTFNRCTFF